LNSLAFFGILDGLSRIELNIDISDVL